MAMVRVKNAPAKECNSRAAQTEAGDGLGQTSPVIGKHVSEEAYGAEEHGNAHAGQQEAHDSAGPESCNSCCAQLVTYYQKKPS